MILSDIALELVHLRRYFGRTRAVDGVSFEVRRGEVFGFIGPNGAGKTTSMRILATLDDPTSGDARIDGFSVVDDPDRVRSRLGFMPDYFQTYANVDVGEYLDFFARAYGLVGAERARAVRWVLKFTGLSELVTKPIDGLSKGMKQRLCLGRALIHNPSVLVLDEPAAGLDPRARIQLREMIRRLGAEGKSVLISSHILTELAEMCDRVAIIERGQILAVGSVAEIQAGRSTTSLVRIQVLGSAEPLSQWLRARADVEQVTTEGDWASLVHRGDRQSEAELLRAMVEQGFPIVAFGCQHRSLEEVFMQVTEGRIQ